MDNDDEDEVVLQRPPREAAKSPAEAAKALREMRGIVPVLKHTAQRKGRLGAGVEIRGGSRQISISFPPDMFDKIAGLARRNGLSLNEQVRQLVANSAWGD